MAYIVRSGAGITVLYLCAHCFGISGRKRTHKCNNKMELQNQTKEQSVVGFDHLSGWLWCAYACVCVCARAGTTFWPNSTLERERDTYNVCAKTIAADKVQSAAKSWRCFCVFLLFIVCCDGTTVCIPDRMRLEAIASCVFERAIDTNTALE